MKKTILTILLLTIIYILSTVNAQNSFKYQAVFRDSNNKPYTNTNIDIRFTILADNPNGTIVFSEKQTVVSSALGLVEANIGQGTNISGNLNNIDWSNGKYFLKIDADVNGNGNYVFYGTNLISKVPTAMFADKCGNTDDADHDPSNELQTLSFDSNSNELSISNGNKVTIPTGATDADADPTNEIQTLTKSGKWVYLSKNGGSFEDAVDDADNNATNEIQTLSKNGNTVTLSKNGGSFEDAVDDADNNATNEIQTLSKTGNTVTLSKNGGSFIDAVDDNDADSTNEIQQLQWDYSNSTMWIDGGTDTFHNYIADLWSLYTTLVWPDTLNLKWGVANYPIVIENLSADTQRTYHIDVLNGGDVWFESDFPETPVLHLWNENIHFDSIDGEFIIEPHSIYSFTDSQNKGFFLNDDQLSFSEYFGAQFKPIEINRNFGIKMSSPAGFKTVDINNENGNLSLYRENGEPKLNIVDFLGGNTALLTYNNLGKTICQLNVIGTNHDHGYMAVSNQNGTIRAGMYVDDNDKGHIFADVKNFVTPDPDNNDKLIMYASLEGPEAAAYDRGRGKLTTGKVFISFKNHFKKIINTKTLTVQLTPMSAESKGLAVTEITNDGFWVEELYNGKGNYNFFWEAKGVRKGFEDYDVIVPKSTLEVQKSEK